jgi:hypothetical protein
MYLPKEEKEGRKERTEGSSGFTKCGVVRKLL